jgi:hypothetical protein
MSPRSVGAVVEREIGFGERQPIATNDGRRACRRTVASKSSATGGEQHENPRTYALCLLLGVPFLLTAGCGTPPTVNGLTR